MRITFKRQSAQKGITAMTEPPPAPPTCTVILTYPQHAALMDILVEYIQSNPNPTQLFEDADEVVRLGDLLTLIAEARPRPVLRKRR